MNREAETNRPASVRPTSRRTATSTGPEKAPLTESSAAGRPYRAAKLRAMTTAYSGNLASTLTEVGRISRNS